MYSAAAYASLSIEASTVQFREEGSVPRDAEVIGRTWLRVKKDGGPDLRFKYNPQIPILLYGVLDITVAGQQSHIRLQVSNRSLAEKLARAFPPAHAAGAHGTGRDAPDPHEDARSKRPQTPQRKSSAYDILEIKEGAPWGQVEAAYRDLARQYHPDKDVGLGVEIREVAERRMKEINVAYDELKRHNR